MERQKKKVEAHKGRHTFRERETERQKDFLQKGEKLDFTQLFLFCFLFLVRSGDLALAWILNFQ